MNYRKRAEKLSERIAGKDADCIAITSLPNLRYFFDYAGQSFERFCCGLLTRDGTRSALVIPSLDKAKAERTAAENVYTWTDNEGYDGALNSAIADLGIEGKVVGCELSMTMGQMDSFKVGVGTSSFVAVTEEISKLRMLKDDQEIAELHKSSRN